ncbi:MAG: iron-sulfur cluster repair di-iron protein [Myxococcales bacterium]|nr:iron-sulfur cluster repair di-iron protein [Myxococcales bacterium]
MSISAETTVSQLATSIPHACRIFERHRIDYCCGGKRPLKEACERVGADVGVVIAALEEAPRDTDARVDWRTAPLGGLVRHILDVHHTFTWNELPRIDFLSEKVARVHGDRHPELRELRQIVVDLVAELTAHLQKEEQVLFPYVERLAEGTATSPPFGSVTAPVRMMDDEHEHAGEMLAAIRRVTGDLVPPSDACGSYRALYAALAELEADLHQHIHLETNILFPRAIELEASRR